MLAEKPTIAELEAILSENPPAQGPGGIIVPEESRFGPVAVDLYFLQKHAPKVGGYLVFYADGYRSFSPAKAFEDGYTRI